MDRWSQDFANKKAWHPPARASSVDRDTSRRRTSSQQRNNTGLYVPDQEEPPRRASRSLRSLPALEQEETTGIFPATGTRRAVRPAKAESSLSETWATAPAGDLDDVLAAVQASRYYEDLLPEAQKREVERLRDVRERHRNRHRKTSEAEHPLAGGIDDSPGHSPVSRTHAPAREQCISEFWRRGRIHPRSDAARFCS